MLNFEFGLGGTELLRWGVLLFLFTAFMAWPLLLVMTRLRSRHEGRVITLYSVMIFLAGSLYFATMLDPLLNHEMARQLYVIYGVMMGGLFVKGAFHALASDRVAQRVPV